MGRKQLEIDFNLSGSSFSKVPSSSATSPVFCPVAPAWTPATRTASERRRRRGPSPRPPSQHSYFLRRSPGPDNHAFLCTHVLHDGFRSDSERMMRDIQRSAGGCQVLLFSATFNERVKDFVTKVIKDGNQIFVKKEDLTLEKVKQYKVQVPDEAAKIEVIRDKIFEFGQKVGQVIIFVRTKQSTKNVHNALTREDYVCSSIQGSLDQAEREKIIQEFKDGYTKVLISTDVLARGFDQAQVNLVINYDMPIKFGTRDEPDYEVYLHRIGRAGRFGRKGAVFNLLCGETDNVVMSKIENYFQHQVPEVRNWKNEEDFETALKDAGLL